MNLNKYLNKNNKLGISNNTFNIKIKYKIIICGNNITIKIMHMFKTIKIWQFKLEINS